MNQIICRLVVGCVLALYFNSVTALAQFPPIGGGGTPCTNCPPTYVNTNRNYVKFMNHEFSVLDTNVVSQTDTNLFNALLAFGNDTNTEPNLQVALYGLNTLLIKANHFDYAPETARHFALLICDKAESPTFKNIDFSGLSDSQDGWLIQGVVPHWKVTGEMYFRVENIARDCNAFFRAIPYNGAEITFTSPQAYDVVSNTIAIQTTISDLSGITNTQFEVTVDGFPARYSLTTNNTILLNTKYTPEGPVNVYLKTVNKPLTCALTNAPDNSQVFFTSLSSLPLTFENDTYLLFQSDYASPEIVTNYFYFVTDKPQTITGSIYDPADGHVMKSFGGNVPFAATISVSWNFTESDGTTPYTNESYAVTFQTSNPTTITFTNKVDSKSVRKGAGCFLTYQDEDPSTAEGSTWNSTAYTRVREDLQFLYKDVYKPISITQYDASQIGTNRNKANCVALTQNTPVWADFMVDNLTNANYSDLTMAGVHCNGYEIGYSKAYLNNKFTAHNLQSWVQNANFYGGARLRKAAIWGCWSGIESGDLTLAQACGILPASYQLSSFCKKNAGLFFQAEIPFFWNSLGITYTTAHAAETFEVAFMCGAFPFPGGCDPTYSIRWSMELTRSVHPQLEFDPRSGKTTLSKPVILGCPKLIYTTTYDDELTALNWNHVKEN